MSEVLGFLPIVGQAFAIFYLLAKILAYITKSSITIYGHRFPRRDGDPPDHVRGTFVLRNEEDVPIESGMLVTLSIDQAGGCFVTGPRVRCGARQKIAASRLDAERKAFVMECPRFPALDTWLIEFEAAVSPENVWISIEPRAENPGRFAEISVQRYSLGAPNELAFPRARPSWAVGLCATAAAVLIYLFPVLYFSEASAHSSRYFTPPEPWLDGILLTLLVVLSCFVFRLSRRAPAPVILGSLDHVE